MKGRHQKAVPREERPEEFLLKSPGLLEPLERDSIELTKWKEFLSKKMPEEDDEEKNERWKIQRSL